MTKLEERLREIEQRRKEWYDAKKPAHLLEHHGDDKFHALFCPDPIVGAEMTIRNVWYNGAPEFPREAVPLLSWHPLVFASMDAPLLWQTIYAALDGFDAEQAWHWQDETTRWTYLTLHDPNPEGAKDFIPTNFVFRVHRDSHGKWTNSLEAAS